MNLTGKCKEDFEKWYLEDYTFGISHISFIDFDAIPMKSMQYGVLVDYFDSVGLNILLTVEWDYGYIIAENRYEEIEEVKKWYDTRPEARTAAIEKANDLRNEQLSK